MYSQDEITYGLFGIDPAEYYATKFLENVLDVKAEVSNKAVTGSIIYLKTDLLIDAVKKYQPKKILDLGCGSGAFGARIKYHCPSVQVYGVDLSDQCAQVAKKNHYDDAISYDVLRGLPYPDETFDLLFAMDFFGHIEFKNKDRIINEIHRVTKRGGYGFHGIETGFVDYYQCNPNDNEDPIRKYVHKEGHIGVEPLEAIIGRFGKKFNIITAYPFPFSPFLNIDNVMISGFWGQEFDAAIKPWINYNAKVVFDVAMGYCNKYVLNMLIEIFGNVLTQEKLKGLNIPGLEKLVKGCGFSFTLVQKVELN